MKKKTLIIVLIMLICTIVGIKTYKTYMGTEVEEIKKKEKHNNYLTFYVQQDNGSYAEQSGNTFPTGTYQINTSMTKCEDQFGEKVTPSFSMNNGSVTVTSTRTVYCTLYMDKANYTATFNFASDTAPLSGTTWNASWTLPNANQYCLTQSSSLSDCNWINLPQGVNGSYSSSEKFTTTGTFTYYFYVKNASGIMVSANDTITVTDSAPTCSFSVSESSGSVSITFTKSNNATMWYVGSSDIDPSKDSSYTNLAQNIFGPTSLYGYVKNSAGVGSCTIETYVSQTGGCHSTSAGSSGGSGSGSGTCYGVTYSCTESGSCTQSDATATDMRWCTSGSGACGPTTTYSNGNKKTYCNFEVRSGSGGGGGTIWTCQSDVSKPYYSESDCSKNCGSFAGTCATGYNRAIGGAADGNPGSYAICWK